MEYENITQKVSLILESNLQNAKQFQHARFSWRVKCPSGISLQVFSGICGVTVI
jgi:hypothetical protein